MRDWAEYIKGFRRYMNKEQLSQDQMTMLFIKHGFTESDLRAGWVSPLNDRKYYMFDCWLGKDGRCRIANCGSSKVLLAYMHPFTYPKGSPEKDYRYLTITEFEEFLEDIKENQRSLIKQEHALEIERALAQLD